MSRNMKQPNNIDIAISLFKKKERLFWKKWYVSPHLYDKYEACLRAPLKNSLT